MTSTLADLQVSSTSIQYVRVPVSTTPPIDPTSDVVAVAFPVTGHEPTVFATGSWQTISGIYYARCLVGPGAAITLGVGFYDVYVKISDNPETPVLLAGQLEVT